MSCTWIIFKQTRSIRVQLRKINDLICTFYHQSDLLHDLSYQVPLNYRSISLLFCPVDVVEYLDSHQCFMTGVLKVGHLHKIKE